MAKQLNVNLAMTADTSKAKAELQSLQKQIDNLMLSGQKNSIGQGMSAEIQKATQLAAQLKVQLQGATNSTGNLDLTKFNESLRKSNTSIADYRKALQQLGPTGNQVFANLASSIMKAEAPLRRANARLQEFWTTLKNTARWQISSSILHGFMGAIQGAYGYAQDLNESLNNIRIVTGQSVEQMARFAEQANRAAKELSTTTTAYTDAALIYYQQGLDDKAVKARTDVTIKMANVSRQSAEEVSNQMTAIWNNFAKAGENLEYYADVITALGAATASSSEEISTGLEKFASIANTVGLSYEYATSALATITATTRQSADVVGTALKTLFARIQDLDLGKTLEDGVDLGKYSKALKTIGVDVLDAVGNVRQMDDILDDMGEKWGNLTEAQKIATAETVAGQRQYAQLMALMDNWGFMQQNLQTARGSEGTLQKQADIYAESWEAAGKRVKAAAQGIFDTLIDDKAFIGILNGLEKILSGIDSFIKGIGGLKTLLPLIGNIAFTVFNNQIAGSIRNAIDSFKMMTPAGREAAENLRKQTNEELIQMAASSMSGNTGIAMSAVYKDQANLQDYALQKAKDLGDAEQKQLQILLDINTAYGKQVIESGKAVDLAKKQADLTDRNAQRTATRAGGDFNDIAQIRQYQEQLRQAYLDSSKAVEIYDNAVKNMDLSKQSYSWQEILSFIQPLRQQFQELGISVPEEMFTQLKQDLVQAKVAGQDMGFVIEQFRDRLAELPNNVGAIQNLRDAFSNLGLEEKEIDKIISDLCNKYDILRQTTEENKDALDGFKQSTKNTKTSIDNLKTPVDDFSQSITKTVRVLTAFSTLWRGLSNLKTIWKNEDLSGAEKMRQTLSSLTMILPAVITLFNGEAIAVGKAAIAHVAWLASLGPIAWAITGIVAVLAGLVAWLIKVDKEAQKKSLEGQLEAATKKSEELSKALEETKNAADELKSTFDGYNSVIDRLNNCVKGTKTWYEALAEVNKQVEEIVEKYPELREFVRFEDGHAYIDEQGWNKLFEESQRSTAAFQAAANAAKQNEERLKIINSKKGTYGQNEVGAELLKNADQISGLNNKDQLLSILRNSNLGYSDEDYLRSIDYLLNQSEFVTAILELKDSLKENTVLWETNNRIATANMLSGNENVQNSKYADQIIAAVGADYNNIYNRNLQQYNNRQLTQEDADKYLDLIKNTEEYSDIKNLTAGIKNGQISIQGIKSTDGSSYEKSVNISDVTSVLAGSQMYDAINNAAGDMITLFAQSTSEQIAAFITAKTGSQEWMTNADYKNLSDHLINDETTGYYNANNYKYLANASGFKDWNSFAEALSANGQDPLEYFRNFIDVVANFNPVEATEKSLAALQTKYAEIEKITNKLNQGDTISSKDFGKLTDGAKEYFTELADGTYQLIGDAEALRNAIQKDQRAEIISEMRDNRSLGFENGGIAGKTLLGTASSWTDLAEIREDLGGDFDITTLEGYEEHLSRIANSSVLAATSLYEFDAAMAQAKENGIEVSLATQSAALIAIAENYENATQEIQKYKDALLNADEAQIQETTDTLRAAITIGEAAKAYKLDAEALEIQASQIRAANKDMELSAEMAAKMAIANQRMNKGVETLNKNFAGWKKKLAAADKTSADYVQTASEVYDAMRDLINLSDSFEIPADFLESAEHLKLLKQAAKGSQKAINLLGIELASATISGLEFNQAIAEQTNVSEIGFMKAQEAVQAGVDAIRANMDALMAGTMTLDQVMNGSADGWVNALNRMAKATGMSVEQMNDLLASLGVQADVNIITAEEEMDVPTEDIFYQDLPEKTFTSTAEDGSGMPPTSVHYPAVRKIVTPGPLYHTTGYRQIAQISTTANPKKPNIHYTGVGGGAKAGGVSPSSRSGKSSGGGSTPKHDTKETKNIKDELERYHWLNEELDDLQRDYDKVSKSKDRAFGKNRINLINQEIAALDKLIAHNQQYMKSIQANKASDLNALMNGGITKTYTSADKSGAQRQYVVQGLYDYGFGADSFDEHGNLVNYDSIVSAAVARYNAAVEYYNGLSASEQTAAAKDMLHEAELQYESLMELIQQYEETNNLYQDKLEEILESFRQQQDLRLEALQYELELKISFSDADLKRLDYERKMLKDDIFKAAEYLRTIWNSGGSESNWSVLQTRASDVMAHAEQVLNTSHGDIVIDGDGNVISNPDLSDEGWVEALRDVEDEIYNTIDSLWELDDTMCHYYEETLQDGEKRLDALMSKLEDCTKVLQHFQKISELLGKEQEFDWMNEILAGQRDTIRNELEAAKTEYAYAKQQYDNMMQRYNETKGMVDEGTRQKMEDELQAQYESMVKWQDKMYEKTEEYAEASIALYENMVKQQTKIMEDAMTGGMGFDSMLDSMKNVSSTQDMILTKTNQIYETNKLMRQIQQEMDKTNNQAAKARLQSFNAEIEDLQKRNTMSKFDLDIANARYKLLLAQIALEEAQNAKSTVRLQRDNQGNYGYVYTADRDKVENAQQAADDAGNDLYNLSLEKANENAQALIELDKELHDELERIAIEYRGNDEKIQEEQARVREEYAQKRKAIEEDYLTALYWLNETATTDISEAWSTKYQDMIVDTEDWQGIVDDCVRAVEEIYNEWKQDMDENVTPSVGENLDELKGKINEVLKESQTYEQWFNQFAADNARRLDEVSRLTNEYYRQREAVMALIQSLMDYCAAIDAAIRAAAEMESAQQQLNQTMNMPAPTVNTQPTNPGYTPPSGDGGTGYGKPKEKTTTEEKETGCFTADTKILMADFSEKNIIEVQKGDMVLAYNENKNYFEPKQVLGIFYQLKMKQIVKIYLNNGIVLRTTDSHPLLTTDGWKALDVEAANYFHGVKTTQLNLFDTIKGFESDGVVEKIEYITYEDCIPVFTLMVEDCHTFLADGMIVHNVATYTRPKYDYMTYATGGYTGEWTSNNDIASGKLAVLHQKELVLNEQDTENFLNAVKIVRMISQGIDLRAAAGNYGPGLGSPSFSAGNSAFEQQVTITAEFPNATDHSEIEQAFDDLMNRAAQFVGRPTVMPKRFETI